MRFLICTKYIFSIMLGHLLVVLAASASDLSRPSTYCSTDTDKSILVKAQEVFRRERLLASYEAERMAESSRTGMTGMHGMYGMYSSWHCLRDAPQSIAKPEPEHT